MMGSEFMKMTKRTISKYVDKNRVALATRDLFTTFPEDQPRSWVASISSGARVSEGARILAESDGAAIRLRQGNSYVGKLDNPTKDVLAKLSAAGCAGATVQRVLTLSGKIEVQIW
jgi:hypothetical protein